MIYKYFYRPGKKFKEVCARVEEVISKISPIRERIIKKPIITRKEPMRIVHLRNFIGIFILSNSIILLPKNIKLGPIIIA
jgi:hypothetical protein